MKCNENSCKNRTKQKGGESSNCEYTYFSIYRESISNSISIECHFRELYCISFNFFFQFNFVRHFLFIGKNEYFQLHYVNPTKQILRNRYKGEELIESGDSRIRDGRLSSRVRQQREINNPSFLMPRYRASSRLYNAAGARTSDGIVVSRTD